MRKMLIAFLLLLPGQVLAGPPEAMSGRMVLDEVTDGLQRYRAEKDPGRRIQWLRRLETTREPRVGVALGEALFDPDEGVRMQAASGIVQHQTEDLINKTMTGPVSLRWARQWWAEHEADLRRRARMLRK